MRILRILNCRARFSFYRVLIDSLRKATAEMLHLLLSIGDDNDDGGGNCDDDEDDDEDYEHDD